MQTFFVVCAALGGAVLFLQLLLGFLGIVEFHHLDLSSPDEASSGLDLLSVRALSAGAAFFGVGGLFAQWLGLGSILAVPLAALIGGIVMLAVAYAVRSLGRLEADGTVLIEEAIGEHATVYLTIPAGQSGQGKVHLELRGRLTELPAVTPHEALPTGASVMVTDVTGGDTLVVVRDTLSA